MRRLKTILTEIYRDELELFKYSIEDIRKAVDKIEKERGKPLNSTLLDVIYTDESRE